MAHWDLVLVRGWVRQVDPMWDEPTHDGRPHLDGLIPRRSGDPVTVQAQDLGGENYFWSQFVVKGANLFVLQGLVGVVTNIEYLFDSGCAVARDDLTKK